MKKKMKGKDPILLSPCIHTSIVTLPLSTFLHAHPDSPNHSTTNDPKTLPTHATATTPTTPTCIPTAPRAPFLLEEVVPLLPPVVGVVVAPEGAVFVGEVNSGLVVVGGSAAGVGAGMAGAIVAPVVPVVAFELEHSVC
jgi:hypothetical protein